MKGIGVMIGELFGNSSQEDVDALKNSIGKKIADILLMENRLYLKFEDGSCIAIFDDGQSCCERRYMVCDDKFNTFFGALLQDINIQKAGREPYPDDDCDDCHEIQFLIVTTSKGSFTVSNHNEHNGYYGGFSIAVRKIEDANGTKSDPD